jgi:beta-lactamase class A
LGRFFFEKSRVNTQPIVLLLLLRKSRRNYIDALRSPKKNAMSIATKRFSLAHIAAVSLIVSVLTSSATIFLNSGKKAEAEKTQTYSCEYSSRRIEGYRYIKPLLLVDAACESENLSAIKYKINALIEKEKVQGNLSTASVYIKSQNDWLEINGGEKYEPGSLFKVPIMIAILKMNEDNPGFLDKPIAYNQQLIIGRKVNIGSKTIALGNTYTVKQLLEYMIKYSDNQATCLLEMNLDKKVLHKLFTDIGLAAPNMYADKFYFTPRDYSLFMRIIYNAGYLTIKDSEYAAELLGQCDFNDGIVKGLPAGTKVAHKFGETGDENEKQLHETAIIYLDKRPYLLTIMTRGHDFLTLQKFMAEASKLVYEDIKAKADL